MSLLDTYRSGAGGILGILKAINSAAQPSGSPVADPMLEEAAGSQGTQAAQENYRRQYQGQRAAALQSGTPWYALDAAAAPGAQDQYTKDLSRTAQAVDMLRDRREKGGRQEALKQFLGTLGSPQQQALAQANPEAYTEGAIRKQFTPTDRFSMTAIGENSVAVLDKQETDMQKAVHVIHDPNAVKALKNQVASVQQDGTKLRVIGLDGSVINEIEVGEDPKVKAQREKAQKTEILNVRKEFDKLPAVANYRAVLPIINSIKSAPDTAPGDMDFAYAAGKVFDPDSVVREGELAMTLKTGSILAQILGTTRFQLSGKGRMPPEQRAQIQAALDNRADALRQPYLQARDQYSRYAADSGYPAFNVIGDDSADAFKPKARNYVRDPKTNKLVLGK